MLTSLCGVCNKQFSSADEKKLHIKRDHPEYKVCSQSKCAKYFESQEELDCHQKTHNSGSRVCEQCGETFDKSAKLYYHYSSRHPAALVQCDHCDKTFPNKDLMRSHSRYAHSEKVQCEIFSKV